ncbi:MAG: hypothetical protein ABJA37_09240 [Ferruginibacter sp.]
MPKIILLFSIFNGIILFSFADRGVGKKAKTKVSLNIKTTGSFSKDLAFNLKTGLTYKGSLLSNIQSNNSSLLYNTFVTYQKGNTIYIVPFKQKILVPEIHQGYTGMKLIIRHN